MSIATGLTARRARASLAAIALVAVGCGDLLGLDDFSPPESRPTPADLDGAQGGAAGAGPGGAPGAPTLAWWRIFGGRQDDRASSLAIAPDGALWIAGVARGEVDLGSGPAGEPELRGLFAVKLSADGEPLASVRSGGAGEVLEARLAPAPDGSVVLAGVYRGAVSLGSTALPDPAAGHGLFVARLASDGAVQLVEPLGQCAHIAVAGVAVAPDGSVAIAGSKRGDFTAAGILLPGGSDQDALVLTATSQGTIGWARDFRDAGDAADQRWSAVGFDAAGKLHVAGAIAGRLNLGGSIFDGRSRSDGVLLALDGGGQPSLALVVGEGAAVVDASALAVDGDGLLLAGSFTQSVRIGEPLDSAGDADVYVTSLDARAVPRWAARFGGSGPDGAHAVAGTAEGHALVAGSFSGDLQVAPGEPPATSAGGRDVLSFELAADGTLLWARGFGRDEDDAAHALAVDDDGRALLAGGLHGGAQLDGQNLVGIGAEDLFVAAFARDAVIGSR